MDQSPSEEFLKPYREAVRRHGATFKATLWSSPDAQCLRFDVMINLAGFSGCTILDLGCGRGDFAARLLERAIPFTGLIGVDAIPEMIEAARGRHLDRCWFHVADVLCRPQTMTEWNADFICISGMLNTMDQQTAQRVVEDAYEAAAQGVIFNFLSDRPHPRWRKRDVGPAARFDTLDWLDWATKLSSRVSFTQEYLDGHDATILIRHDG
ncbi:MAG: methyltransferase domain-containing protein [Phycisphaerales bacterium]|nr:MAG: methyltransferase domain-containing protein [Phycisphaerales bacterium]